MLQNTYQWHVYTSAGLINSPPLGLYPDAGFSTLPDAAKFAEGINCGLNFVSIFNASGYIYKILPKPNRG